MDLPSFLIYLQLSAPSTLHYLLTLLPNTTIKTLRLTIRSPSPSSTPTFTAHLLPYLHRTLYISSHSPDLFTLTHLLRHPYLLTQTTSLIFDSTTYDRWITGLKTYTDRLTSILPFPSHALTQPTNRAEVRSAYEYWSVQSATCKANQVAGNDVVLLRRLFATGVLPRLKRILILSRSRLTYVEPDEYWKVWQTPRDREWRKKPLWQYLLQPEPFKPSVGTTVRESEGVRAVELLIKMMREVKREGGRGGLRVGAVILDIIGGGQTRATGSMNGNRFDRKWHIDLEELTRPKEVRMGKGKVAMHLLVEQQTEDVFRQENLWEKLIDETLQAGSETIEELTMSNVCLDWFWQYQKSHRGMMLEGSRTLRKLSVQGGWCQNPTEMLTFLRQSTSIREVSISFMDVEGVSWYEVLHDLRRSKVVFDAFELRASRCPLSDGFVHVENSLAAPWCGSSRQIVPWLEGLTTDFPLVQGPG